MIHTFLLCIGFFTSVIATAQTSDLQKMLDNQQSIQTKESTVEINGVTYQKIEFENKNFYIALKGRTTEFPMLLCEGPTGFQSEHLMEGSIKIERRKSIYINALKESCAVKNGQLQTKVELQPELGIFLPESSQATIKNKKLGIDPLNPKMLQFSGGF